MGDEAGADRKTLVVWTQSSQSGIYVDLRLPIDSPGRSVESAKNLGVSPFPAALASTGTHAVQSLLIATDSLPCLLKQKSFAGVLDFKQGDTTASGEALKKDKALAELAASQAPGCIPLCTCLWRRDLDFQPPSGGFDIGVCASGPPDAGDGTILMRETGEDASYAEGWLRLKDTELGPFLALRLLSENGIADARDGYWVRANHRFAYAIGRPKTLEAARLLGCPTESIRIKDCVGKVLSDAIETTTTSTTEPHQILNIAFSYVAVAGEIDADGNWNIHHSINPELVGCRLVAGKNSSSSNELTCSRLRRVNVPGQEDDDVEQLIPRIGGDMTRRWRIMEQIACDLP